MDAASRLHFDADETLPYYWGDLDMLATVLINLIDNAVKYSPDHSLIGIVARATPDAIMLSVADRGIGIPPAEAGLIGRPSFRPSTPKPATAPDPTGPASRRDRQCPPML